MYFDYKMAKVNRLKSGIIDDHSLHKIRIHLRMVADILWYFKKLKLKKELNLSTQSLTNLNSQLGIWHDEAVFINSLMMLAEQQPKKNLRLENFIKRKEKHCEEMKEQIFDLLRKLDSGLLDSVSDS